MEKREGMFVSATEIAEAIPFFCCEKIFIDRKGKISIIKSKYNFSSGIG